jgi:hypothetical protein
MEGRKAKQVLDRVISVMKMMRKWRTRVFWKWEEMKSAEQWCFSIGKKVTSVHQRCFSIVKACLLEGKSASPVL